MELLSPLCFDCVRLWVRWSVCVARFRLSPCLSPRQEYAAQTPNRKSPNSFGSIRVDYGNDGDHSGRELSQGVISSFPCVLSTRAGQYELRLLPEQFYVCIQVVSMFTIKTVNKFLPYIDNDELTRPKVLCDRDGGNWLSQ